MPVMEASGILFKEFAGNKMLFPISIQSKKIAMSIVSDIEQIRTAVFGGII